MWAKGTIRTQGYFCSNPACAYYLITNETIHALVGVGSHGKYEDIQDLLCQACHKKFTVRRHTVLYRLKTHSATVRLVLNLLAIGVDASAIEETVNLRESTIRTWLCRSGEQGRKLHQRFLVNLTSFVERANLTIRQSFSKLTRRTWGTAQFTPELSEHLFWWMAYYHFCRYHESLRVKLEHPIQRKGKQRPIQYRRMTPATAAGLTHQRCSVMELISYPLP